MTATNSTRFITKTANRAAAKASKMKVASAEKVEKTAKAPRETKFTSPTDKIALSIIEKIRTDRAMFLLNETQLNEDASISTRSYSARIGTATVFIGRHEQAGRRGREIIGRAFILIQPDAGKELEITGPLAGCAWHVITNPPKGRGKVEIDSDAVDSAAAALGL